MNHQWLERLRNQLKNHEEAPPQGLWQELEKELFKPAKKKGIVLYTEEVKRNMLLFYRSYGSRAAAFAGLLLASLFVWTYVKQSNHLDKPQVAYQQSRQEASSIIQAPLDSMNVLNQTPSRELGTLSAIESTVRMDSNFLKVEATGSLKNQPPAFAKLKKSASSDRQLTNLEALLSQKLGIFTPAKLKNQRVEARGGNPQERVLTAYTDQLAVQASSLDTSQAKETQTASVRPGIDPRQENARLAEAAEDKQDIKHSRQWMGNVAVSQGLPNSSEQYIGYTNSSGISVDGLLASAMAEFSPLAEVIEANEYEVVATNVKHKTPLTAVLSFQYQLSQRLSLTTGVTYTRLESDLRSGSLTSYLNREQTLHYTGVPLQLNYQVLTRGRFTGYVAMGGQVRKAVYGTLKTTYTVNAEKRTESVETLKEKHWDFSVNAAAGFQYTLTPGLSLFIEPGLEYHVHRPTTIPTIYQEQPLLFNAHFGLRFKLK